MFHTFHIFSCWGGREGGGLGLIRKLLGRRFPSRPFFQAATTAKDKKKRKTWKWNEPNCTPPRISDARRKCGIENNLRDQLFIIFLLCTLCTLVHPALLFLFTFNFVQYYWVVTYSRSAVFSNGRNSVYFLNRRLFVVYRCKSGDPVLPTTYYLFCKVSVNVKYSV